MFLYVYKYSMLITQIFYRDVLVFDKKQIFKSDRIFFFYCSGSWYSLNIKSLNKVITITITILKIERERRYFCIMSLRFVISVDHKRDILANLLFIRVEIVDSSIEMDIEQRSNKKIKLIFLL